jgi:hypothetical protein
VSSSERLKGLQRLLWTQALLIHTSTFVSVPPTAQQFCVAHNPRWQISISSMTWSHGPQVLSHPPEMHLGKAKREDQDVTIINANLIIN